jgi:hypothetical protein
LENIPTSSTQLTGGAGGIGFTSSINSNSMVMFLVVAAVVELELVQAQDSLRWHWQKEQRLKSWQTHWPRTVKGSEVLMARQKTDSAVAGPRYWQ